MMSHIGYRRMFLALYMYGLLLTMQMRFKVVRIPLSPKRTVSTWLGAGHYKYIHIWMEKLIYKLYQNSLLSSAFQPKSSSYHDLCKLINRSHLLIIILFGDHFRKTKGPCLVVRIAIWKVQLQVLTLFIVICWIPNQKCQLLIHDLCQLIDRGHLLYFKGLNLQTAMMHKDLEPSGL